MMKLIWFHLKYMTLFALFLQNVPSGAVLTQLHIIFRHGERAPTDTFPTDPYINYSWPGGWGQLTNRGKLQIYQLGQRIRSDYALFIPKEYWYQNVNVTSSYSERCLMSSQLFCAGLFPPEGSQIWNKELNWQPIPSHYLPRDQDTNIAMKAPCEKYDNLFKGIRQTPPVAEIENNYSELKNYLSKNTGMEVKNIEDVESISNTLEIEKLHNFTLPSWINASMMVTMRELAIRNLALYSETEYMKRIKGGTYLKNMLGAMDEILSHTTGPKLYLYSAHDLTIVHILRTLDLVDTIGPDFGATLIFELYSDGEIQVQYRNSWNDISKHLTTKCPSPCNIINFKKTYENVLPREYLAECKISNEDL